MKALSSLINLAITGVAVTAAQIPFGTSARSTHASTPPHQLELSSESSPLSITSDTFTTLTHPDFKDHSIRIKNTTGWCDPTAQSYTGYIDAGTRHFFFYFFESRTSPDTDPLIMWTNGGPGGSSSMGAFMELGACSIISPNETVVNKHSWNEVSNIVFIDQPVGVGFSYSDAETVVGTAEQAGKDVHAFLSIFTETFKSFRGREIHLAGESYGGRYLPVFASEIVHQNQKLAMNESDGSRSALNLRSVLIGNGLTDEVTMLSSYYEQACSASNALGHPVLDIRTCIKMQQDVHRCQKMMAKACRDHVSEPECTIAIEYCNDAFQTPLVEAQINPYDISKTCTTLGEDLCFPEIRDIGGYLNQPKIRSKIGVDPRVGNYSMVAVKVRDAFGKTNDAHAATQYHLTGLLEAGIRVLIFVGKLDWICNYIGNRQMLQDLEWSGMAEYRSEEFRKWEMEGEVKGETKSSGNLTYLDIEGAGHAVPREKPAEALEMLKRWLKEKAI